MLSLAGLLACVRFLAPGVWDAQFLASPVRLVAVFALVSLFNAFMEYLFHRYVLHKPAMRWLSRFYRLHTRHHGLTRIARRSGRVGGRKLVFIENRFPITEPEQHEASFFPWYSLAAFGLLLTPLLAALQWIAPSFPWFLGGFAALAVSLALYELLHAMNHWPFETWLPLIEHPRWGRFWRPVYGFHLRHHAVIDCNESISGFFGLPVADWVFGTCLIPQTVYGDGEEWTKGKFRSPRPCWLIRRLDVLAERAVARHRAAAKATAIDEALEEEPSASSKSEFPVPLEEVEPSQVAG